MRTLRPEDFAIFGHYTYREGVLYEVWLPGPKVIADLRLGKQPAITVDTCGTLNIVSNNREAPHRFQCQKKYWKLMSELKSRASR